MDFLLTPLRRWADFEGRSRRAEFWPFQAGLFVLLFLYGFVGALLGPDTSAGLLFKLIAGLGLLAFMVPNLALSVRRLHDIDRTGWWVLLNILPYIGAVILLVLFALDGTPGYNRFGPDPKGRGDADPSVFS